MSSDLVGPNEELQGLKGDERIIAEARPSCAQLSEWMRYDAASGDIFWTRVRNGRAKGNLCDRLVAPIRHPSGYIFVSFENRKYGAHRLAWVLETGEWQPPAMQIDHINGVRDDNRFCNLRLATPLQNQWNSRRPQKGVRLHSCGKWEARISVNGTSTYLGLHTTADEAKAAYNLAALSHFGEFCAF